MRDKGSCSIMDENILGTPGLPDRPEPIVNGLLPRSPANHKPERGEGGKRHCHLFLLTRCNHHPDLINAGVCRKAINTVPDHRLSPDRLKLLGKVQACSRTNACGHDKRMRLEGGITGFNHQPRSTLRIAMKQFLPRN